MARQIDALTSATLKNLREQWWDTEFSTFLQDTLRPKPGTRILDVGCGEGTAELTLGRLRVWPAIPIRLLSMPEARTRSSRIGPVAPPDR